LGRLEGPAQPEAWAGGGREPAGGAAPDVGLPGSPGTSSGGTPPAGPPTRGGPSPKRRPAGPSTCPPPPASGRTGAGRRGGGARMGAFLKQRGESLTAKVRAENVLSEEQRKQFQSLGYLGNGGGGRVGRELPDPRRMTDVAQALDRATEQVQAKDCKGALP